MRTNEANREGGEEIEVCEIILKRKNYQFEKSYLLHTRDCLDDAFMERSILVTDRKE